VELALYNQLAFNTAIARIGVVLGVGALAITLLLCVAGLGLLSVGTASRGEFFGDRAVLPKSDGRHSELLSFRRGDIRFCCCQSSNH